MNGKRNGYDSICFALSIIAITLLVLSTVIDDELYRMVPVILSGIAIGYMIYRILSTNIAKRRYEADRFSSIFKNDPYKRFKCPKCGTVCRVPKGRGKIKITCPHCKEQFIKKT